MKYLGILFIMISSGTVGIQMALELKRYCNLIRQLINALQILHNEINCNGTPLPQAFALVAVSATDSVERLFSGMAKALDQRRWMTPLAAMEQQICNEASIKEKTEISEVLKTLASGLGRYDRESQLQSVNYANKRLADLLDKAEQDHSIRGKTYKTLGICAGISLAILLV